MSIDFCNYYYRVANFTVHSSLIKSWLSYVNHLILDKLHECLIIFDIMITTAQLKYALITKFMTGNSQMTPYYTSYLITKYITGNSQITQYLTSYC